MEITLISARGDNERERSTKGERERVLGLPSGKRNPGLDRGSLCPWPY